MGEVYDNDTIIKFNITLPHWYVILIFIIFNAYPFYFFNILVAFSKQLKFKKMYSVQALTNRNLHFTIRPKQLKNYYFRKWYFKFSLYSIFIFMLLKQGLQRHQRTNL